MKFLRQLLGPFIILAGIGFLVCLVLHAAALMGMWWHGNRFLILVVGIFVVGVPAVVMSHEMAPRVMNPVRQWNLTTAGAPQWMRVGALVLMFYAVVTFFIMATTRPDAEPVANEMKPWELAMFTAWLMAVYFWAMTTMYAAKRQQATGYVRVCPNGHQVRPAARYCERCGTEIK